MFRRRSWILAALAAGCVVSVARVPAASADPDRVRAYELGPPARWGAPMLRTRTNGRLLLYDAPNALAPNPRISELEDPWQLDASGRWSRIPLEPPIDPTPVSFVVPDARRERFVLFGNATHGTDTTTHAWRLDLSASPVWSALPPVHASLRFALTATTPDRIWMTSDRANDESRSLWSGSLVDSGTWQLERQLPPEPSPPEPRTLVVDIARGRVLSFRPRFGPVDSLLVESTSTGGAEGWSFVSCEAFPELLALRWVLADSARSRLVFCCSHETWSAAGVERSSSLWAWDLAADGSWVRLATWPFVAYTLCADEDSVSVHGLAESGARHAVRTLAAGWDRLDAWRIESDPVRPETGSCEALLRDVTGNRWWAVGEHDVSSSGVPRIVGFDSLWTATRRGDLLEWRRVHVAGSSPVAREYAGWAVDDARGVAWLWGGWDPESRSVLHDLWRLELGDAPRWGEVLADDPTRPGFSAPAFVFDPVARRLVGFSAASRDTAPTAVWTYDVDVPSEWRSERPPGSFPTGGSIGTSAVFDPLRDRIVFANGRAPHRGALQLRPSMRWSSGGPDCGPTPDYCHPYTTGLLGLLDPVTGRTLHPAPDGVLWVDDVSDSLTPLRRIEVWGGLKTSNAALTGGYDDSRDDFLLDVGTGALRRFWSLRIERGATPAMLWTRAEAQPDQIALAWTGPPGAMLDLWRRTTESAWQWTAIVRASVSGEASFRDRAIDAGTTYGYRLARTGNVLAPVAADAWVTASGTASFSLGRAFPNPSAGRIQLAFTVPTNEPATIELLDLAGRSVWSRTLVAPGAGPHTLAVAPEGRLRSGFYVARLRQRGLARTTRVVIVR